MKRWSQGGRKARAVAGGLGVVLATGSPSAAAALYGYCATRVASERVCSEITEVTLSDSLLERCPPWARWVAGQGWSYRNSQDRTILEEEQAKGCVRTVPLDSGVPHRCLAVISCPSQEEPRQEIDLETTMRAYDRENALIRCSKAAGPKYLEWLVKLARESSGECSLSMEVKPQDSSSPAQGRSSQVLATPGASLSERGR